MIVFVCRLTGLIALLLATGVQGASTPVVVTGHQSPLGLPFSTFANLALMADGSVAFLGSSSGAFRRDVDTIAHVIAAGDVLADGRVVAGVSPPAVCPGTCTVVRAFLVNGGSRILQRCGNTTTVVATTGEAAPGGGVFAEFIDGVACGSAGRVAFTAVLDDDTSGLFVATNRVLTDTIRTGSPAPSGGIFTALRLIGVATDGRVGFRGTVASGRDGLFVAGGSGGLEHVVETGEATPIGSTFRSVTNASMNDAGMFAFRGDLSEDGKAGVFRADTSGPVPLIEPVVLEGASVEGPTITIRSLPSSLTPSINAGGTIAFRATLSGAKGGSAIFAAPPGGVLQRIVSARDQTAVGSLVRLRDPVIADDGSLVIPASVTGSGPLLIVARQGTFSALAKVGQATDIDTGDERFRFSQPSVRGSAEGAVFTGTREGIFVAGRDGSREMLAFVGGAAPSTLGGTFAGFDPPAGDEPGVVAFGVEVTGGKVARRAIVASGARGLGMAAESSQPVRGGRLVDFFASTIDSLTRPDVGPRGEIAFEATLEGGKTPRALLLKRGGRPQPVAQARKVAPGGGRFDTFGTPAVLRGGNLAFVAQVGTGDEPRLILRRGSRLLLLARQGSGAPGRFGGHFDTFDPPTASDSLVGLRATLDQGGKEGIFLASPKTLGMLVGTGDAAPGGGSFRGFSTPVMGSSHMVFLGRLIGSPTPPGLYRVRADAVPAGDAGAAATDVLGLPGAPSPLGGAIEEFGSFAANRSDAVAVVADLVGASARSALFVLDAGETIVP